ncbi:MAG: hypothetical protein II989_02140 [Bacteroidales bacterium]|nr:hypothetical protein [Bacteroidales bacterium]
MRTGIIPILLSGFIVLTSMSECKKHNLLYHLVDNPVSFILNGIQFQSQPERVNNYGGSAHEFDTDDNGFFFSMSRELMSETDEYTLHIYLKSTEPFELNKRYSVCEMVDMAENNVGYASLLSFTDGFVAYHDAISGWIEFTDVSKGDHNYISGKFEMNCEDYDDNDLTFMEIRNGQFGPLRVE